jgi:hypothetical protein
MRTHPAAELFPMLDEEALTALENDIKLDGQLQPIILWNGMIVDGRNRYAACIRAGIKPKTKDITFASEAKCISYIISTNIHRRHLTVDQRADIADELAKLRPGDNQHTREVASKEATSPVMTQGEAAKAMGVSRATVQRIHSVKESAPDLAVKVKSGEMKVGKAASLARERSRPAPPVTDPNRADDAVADTKIERAADGYTPKMEKVWASYSALDAVEQTAFYERLESNK